MRLSRAYAAQNGDILLTTRSAIHRVRCPRCRFAPTGGRWTEIYRATVTKIGLDVGVTGTTTMIWTVLAASQPRRGGALSGSYGGASADVAIGVGGGGKVLIGGSAKSIVLQPPSVQGQTGLNIAIGVAGMTLRRS
jgi:uncharacterized protein DUF992